MAARDASPTSTSSTLSNITVQTEKQVDARIMSSASPSISTPPTSLDDECSVLSDTTKAEQSSEVTEGNHVPRGLENAPDTPGPPQDVPPSDGRRSARSSRKSVATYNVQILAGTAIHTPTKYLEKHHKNVLHGSIDSPTDDKDDSTPAKKRVMKAKLASTSVEDPVEQQLVSEAAQAARRRTSSRVTDLRKEALRNISGVGNVVANVLSDGKALVQNTLKRSASDPALQSSKLKRTLHMKGDDVGSDADGASDQQPQKSKAKLWLRQGLYVGQHRDFNPRLSETQNRARKRAKKRQDGEALPLPMFAADRILNEDPHHVFKDFKLPFDTYHPLPRKVKVDGWVKLSKNRFIGEASALWKRDKQDASQCYCDAEDGCGEACHNRIMAYECDNTNCPLGPELCGNRPFAELKRRAKGNRYDYGVEVTDTPDRGYGVRAMRMFEPHQIIVEYAGEIITQSECERRMKQVYKKDKCYYLMSFDNKMIIDATRGTIARFVNHSCEPNCEMIKWTVGGEPRMALFAGPRGIMTGEELTYDYNFDPFSQKNIQQCRCGTASCRGVLGPKPKKPIEDKSIASTIIAGTKRKFQTLLGSVRAKSDDNHTSTKKRKLHTGNAITIKTKNTGVQSEMARERAGREAAEHSRQIASRETRALKRSTPAGSRAPLRRKVPLKRSTRITKVSFQPKKSKEGALKSIKQASRGMSRPTSYLLDRPRTPMQTDSDEDCSPNITPASLRSASRKSEMTNPASRGRLSKVESFTEFDQAHARSSRTSLAGGPRGKQNASKNESKGSRAATGTLGHDAQGRSRSTTQR
ncbi:hypothetical protein HBI38_009850 [Parastagonospora nodorum]|nr:hypothetical protein HBI73_009200 [Parastagonospora nodorum]KAH6110796.1 hypothetical protein HBI65_012470 [Parastagonospora nodorum]KAH6282195.1 hypothetical protein HBI41_005910 [Parastagonospora nodorum]KAH6306200.1 hypothetical protein HBI40_009870 [Parastagonospora nodorum]KAH6333215.1 hypothetical protein HBI38_009850 [Parastagonospora nodorum]